MRTQGYASTDPGVRKQTNEDYYLMDEELGLYVVCDGVGGHVSGNLASETCAKAIRQAVWDGQAILQKYKNDRSLKNRAVVAGLLQKAILAANEQIYQMAEVDVMKKGMCTTVAALLVLDDYGIIGTAGDSRIYLSRGNQVHQLTEDHKYATEMVKRGILTAEEAARSPQGNVLTRAVGFQPTLQVDTLQVELMSGDIFLLCSDGLHGYFQKNELRTYLNEDLPRVAENLVKLARERGGHDNITGLVVRTELEAPTKTVAIDVLKKTELLGKIPIFRYLNYAEINKILGIAHVRNYPKLTIMVAEGQVSEEMFIIAAGSAEVIKGGVQVAIRMRGEVFGEMGIFDNAPRSATVRAAENVTALVLNRKEFLSLLRQESQIAVKFLWALNHELNMRLRRATDNLAITMSAGNTQLIQLPFESPEEKS